MIRTAALGAWEDRQTMDAAARQAARDELVAAARVRIGELPAPDGTMPLAGKLKDDGKSPAVHVDMGERLVVIDDGTATVSVRELADGTREVRLVELVDGAWTRRSEPVGTLAELGAAIEDSGS